MKQLNETFEDDEFDFLRKKKKEKTWRQFILELTGYNEKRINK